MLDVTAPAVLFYVRDHIPRSTHISPHTTPKANIRRTANFKNFFVSAAFHPISLTARSIVLAHLSASKRFLPLSPRKIALFYTYEDTESLCFTQPTFDEAAIRSDSVTSRFRGKPLVELCKSPFLAHTRDFLCLLLGPSESDLKKDS